MASVFARHALGRAAAFRVARQIQCRTRALHSTSLTLKKKATATEIIELFDDNANESEELFTGQPVEPKPAVSEARAAPSASASKVQPTKKLPTEDRRARFDILYEYIVPRIGRHPKIPFPPVKHSIFDIMLDLSTTPEDLEKIAELFPHWKDMGFKPRERTSDHFVRRCQELNSPHLAIQVYGHYARYGVKLTLPGARLLLHSLHLTHPIQDVLTACALYRVHALPPVSEDLVSCCLLLTACLKDGSKDTANIAEALIGHLKVILQKTDAQSMHVPRHPREGAKEKSKVWVKRTLKKIDGALERKYGKRQDWLAQWRQESDSATKKTVLSS